MLGFEYKFRSVNVLLIAKIFRIVVCIFFIVFVYVVPSCFSQNKEKIKWYHEEFPPILLGDVQSEQKGWGNNITSMIIDEIPEYEHEVYYAPLARLFSDSQKGINACHAFLFKTPERQKLLYFSEPYFFAVPNGVIIDKYDLDRFRAYINSEGRISLRKMLSDKQLTLGVVRNIAYGPRIDSILAQQTDTSNIFIRKGDDGVKGLLSMLAVNHVDYIISYSSHVNYWAPQIGMEGRFMYLPIEELSDRKINAIHVACSKTQINKEFLILINKRLRTRKFIEKAMTHYLKWLDRYAQSELQRIKETFIQQELIN